MKSCIEEANQEELLNVDECILCILCTQDHVYLDQLLSELLDFNNRSSSVCSDKVHKIECDCGPLVHPCLLLHPKVHLSSTYSVVECISYTKQCDGCWRQKMSSVCS